MRVHRVGAFPADVGEAATIPELIQVATHIARFDQDDVAVIVGVAGVFIAGIGIDQLIDLCPNDGMDGMGGMVEGELVGIVVGFEGDHGSSRVKRKSFTRDLFSLSSSINN